MPRTSSGSGPGTAARMRACRAPRPPRWSTAVPPEAVRYASGRLFSEQELQLIRTIIAEDSSRHAVRPLAGGVRTVHWRRANGQLKDMSCRVAMLRMHRDRLIPLPAPRRRHSNGTLHRRRTPCRRNRSCRSSPASMRCRRRTRYDRSPTSARSAVVARVRGPHHYLGYTPLPGAQMRNLVTSQRRVLAGRRLWRQRLEGGSPRRRFIGWSVAQSAKPPRRRLRLPLLPLASACSWS